MNDHVLNKINSKIIPIIKNRHQIFIDPELITFFLSIKNINAKISCLNYSSDNLSLPDNNDSVIFIIRPNNKILINNFVKQNDIVYLVPHETYFNHGINLKLYWLPVCNNVLSMELNHIFKDMVNDDYSSSPILVNALLKLGKMYGCFKNITTLGKYSEIINKAMLQKQSIHDKIGIVNLIIMDRTTDLITPLITQSTYQGLIDEFFEITGNRIKNEPNIILDNNSYIYQNIKYLNFSNVGYFLSNKCKNIKQYRENITKNSSIKELKNMVKELPEIINQQNDIEIHIDLAEKILKKKLIISEQIEIEQYLLLGKKLNKCHDYIEECINKHESFTKIFRLYLLYSHIQKNNSQLNDLNNNIINTYGYHYLLVLNFFKKINLQKNPYLNYLNTNEPIIIFFIGGCIYDEISMIKNICPHCIIVTTNITNGNKLIENINMYNI
ncbi:vacuolar protein sorting-associated protein [Megavirus chiliensis]|uniref:Vacuolar sorting-associated n=2 Tax=Megamimivirinae TaxID=3044648 RepID=A0A2L2DM73_MIMIV|nr:vacuolar protein sorting-associated protein [Megavirus chiliensis]AEQ33206.1 vacuolar protein sorting-associated protein [Megavirus chiliensis]AVG47254.1 vacuolar sorting-associated [Acanthamoeba polyphaga mimivirus]